MTEMDIIEAKYLDSFDSNLSQEDSQTLHCALSTPFLRIPLVMDFFSRGRAGALFSTKLAALCEAAVLEPGLWAPVGTQMEFDVVPCYDPVRTSCGLLWNEAEQSSTALLKDICSLLRDAVSISVGGHDSAYVCLLYTSPSPRD